MAVTNPTTRLDLFTVPWGKPEECHAIVDFGGGSIRRL